MGEAFGLFPVAASEQAASVDVLYFTLIVMTGVTGLILATLVVVFCARYRQGRVVDRRDKPPVGRIEYAWTIVPLLLFLGVFAWGAVLYVDGRTAPLDALRIHAIGKQWMWKFQHPGGQREINTLHLPVGRPVEVVLGSQDAIHSFFVPAFRVKQDAVPGHVTSTWFTPTRVGRYRLFCAEYCGLDHSGMRGVVVVMRPDDFEAWLASAATPGPLAAQGRRMFERFGCAECHDPGSSVDAPALAGLFGRRVALAAGGTVAADEAYIRDSILLPDKHVTAGFAATMPSYAGQLDAEGIVPLIAYVRSLSGGGGTD